MSHAVNNFIWSSQNRAPLPSSSRLYCCVWIDLNLPTLQRALLVKRNSARERSGWREDKHNSEFRLPTTKRQHVRNIQVTASYPSFYFLLLLPKSRLQAATSKDSLFFWYLFVSKAICAFFNLLSAAGEDTSITSILFLFTTTSEVLIHQQAYCRIPHYYLLTSVYNMNLSMHCYIPLKEIIKRFHSSTPFTLPDYVWSGYFVPPSVIHYHFQTQNTFAH